MASIAAAPYGAPPTGLTQLQVNQLYEILARFDKLAIDMGLHYTMAAGTALGAYLRGGLIPWDSDADIHAVHDKFVEMLPRIKLVEKLYGLRIEQHLMEETRFSGKCGWYKIHLGDIKEPNVDIFLLEYKDDKKFWSDSDTHQYKWRKGRRHLYSEQFFSVRRIPFGPLNLPIFAQPERYFDAYYGVEWRIRSREREVTEKVPPSHFTDFRPALPTS